MDLDMPPHPLKYHFLADFFLAHLFKMGITRIQAIWYMNLLSATVLVGPLVLRGRVEVASWEPEGFHAADGDFINALGPLYAKDPLLGPALKEGIKAQNFSSTVLGDDMGKGGMGFGPNAFKRRRSLRKTGSVCTQSCKHRSCRSSSRSGEAGSE